MEITFHGDDSIHGEMWKTGFFTKSYIVMIAVLI